ncbi:MAG: hypothetical protein Q9191_004065 [Dirinaria sp. TL-2023a]
MEAQSSNHIVQLASVISTNTNKFDNWLTSHGIPSPSFGIETPPKLQVPKDIAQARQATVDALSKWPGSEEPNHTGFSLSNNTDDPLFTLLEKFPGRSKRFANTMSMMSTYEGFEPEHLVAAFPWDTFQAKTFVDIGGYYGRNSIVLAENVEGIQCIVQDLPAVIAKRDFNLSPELKDRVQFMEHDFFTKQPVKGADVYFFR